MVVFHNYGQHTKSELENGPVEIVDLPSYIAWWFSIVMAIEIVDLPINSMVFFHSYVKVFQRIPEVQMTIA